MTETTVSRTPSIKSQLNQAKDAVALSNILISERERLKAINQASPQGVKSCRALTEAVDLVIHRLFTLCLPEDPLVRETLRPRIAVVATGSYGRKELCPYSDIDVTFVVGEEEDALLDATVRKLFMMIMETFNRRTGLRVGYGYRSMSDLFQLDHQIQTSLLDARAVAGSAGLTNRFVQEMLRNLWPAAFVRLKVRERRGLADKHGGTRYRVEPEVREGAGGLRDIHLAEWLAAASFPQTRGDIWKQLQRLGIVTRADVAQASAARDFLLKVRTWMHWSTGRKAELLVRERQEQLAKALGYADAPPTSRVERFMEDYYTHAEHAEEVSGFVVERCLNERLNLTDELVCSGHDLLAAYPWIRVQRPGFLVDVCRHFQEHGLVPGHELHRLIAQHVGTCPDLGGDPPAAEEFGRLLQAPSPDKPSPYTQSVGSATPGVYATLTLMADLGILQRLIPEFQTAFHRVPFDAIHNHTVGHHSLEVVRSLENLRTTREERLSLFRRIWGEVQAPQVLFLAGLLHDLGKVVPIPDHSEAGSHLAEQICQRMKMSEAASQSVAKLVRHHLLMSDTAQLKDLTLNETITDFVSVIDSLDLLHMLTLLTYADIEATGVMNNAKIRYLEDLYHRAEPLLSGAVSDLALNAEEARRFQARLSRHLAGADLSIETIREHTDSMPVSYLLNSRPEQIARHLRMIEALPHGDPVVQMESDPSDQMTTVHICTQERPTPGLLSLIAGVFHAHGVLVHGAQIYTRGGPEPIALDTLLADYHGRAIPAIHWLELQRELVETLRSGEIEPVFQRHRVQLSTPIPPRSIRIDQESADRQTVIQIESDDQPGLLYLITRTIAALGWNIHSARISSLGDRSRDVFYVTGPDNEKLHDPQSTLIRAFTDRFIQGRGIE